MDGAGLRRVLRGVLVDTLIVLAITIPALTVTSLVAATSRTSPMTAREAEITLRDGRVLTAEGKDATERLLTEHGDEVKSVSYSPVPGPGASLVLLAGMYAFFAGLVVAGLRRARGAVWLSVRPRWVPVGLGVGAALLGLGWLYDRFLGAAGLEGPDLAAVFRMLRSPGMTFVLVAVVGPFAEEIYFRGRLFDLLRGEGSERTAIWGTALLFGAAHAIPIYFPVYVAFGWALAQLRLRSGGIAATFAAHALNNAVLMGLTLWGGG